MTEVISTGIDIDDTSVVREFYKVRPSKVKKVSLSVFAAIVAEKEDALIKHVESQGRTVVSVHSEPVSNRRYKRNVAKALKRRFQI